MRNVLLAVGIVAIAGVCVAEECTISQLKCCYGATPNESCCDCTKPLDYYEAQNLEKEHEGIVNTPGAQPADNGQSVYRTVKGRYV